MAMANGMAREALGYLDGHIEDWKRVLVDLCRIPSMSASGFPVEQVRRSAQAVAQALKDAGVENVQVLTIPGVHPYVYGEWLHRPGAPTVLLYGHHDVQPPGREEKWLSPAFEPTERNGRLYGRGTADDKGGVMAHVAAVGSYLRSAGTLPVNVKFIIEGEEEIGSMNLGRFLEQYKKSVAADFIVLTDTRNYDVGHPALTYQLRGICKLDLEVQALHQPLHSGYSGPVPDPVQILCALIADLRAKDGALNVPGLYKSVAKPSAKQLARIRSLPLSEAKFKKDSGMLPGVQLWGEKKFSLLERMWTRPALTVIALAARDALVMEEQMVALNKEPPLEIWPSLPLADWQDTHDTLHMWMQIIGKTRLALAPKQNHWWHVPLYVSARGLTTTPIPYAARTFEVELDFIDHRLIVETSEGTIREIALRPQAVADFYREYTDVLARLGIVVKLWPVPVEVDHPTPFLEDRLHASYDSTHAHRFFRILLQADRIMKRFQGRFLGKTSPVHFFWGAFDLALTRFSGRRVSEHKETEWWVLREANSHEEISVGFWPGSGTVAEPAFYAYARPEPPGLASTAIRPAGAYYSRELGDFILPYEVVRSASTPDEMVLDFYQSAYDAGADLARWDRAALDRPRAEWV